MPEEERGGQFTRQRPAVYRDERHIPAFAVVVDGLCYRFFAGSVGTENHYRHIGWGDQSGKLFHLQDFGACTVKLHLLFLAHRSHRAEHIFR